MWSLVTLGSLRLVNARTGEECLRGRRKELVLLAFLARRAPRFVPRAVLADLLWGDKDEDRARASLRQALSHLRRTLGDALDLRTDGVALLAGLVAVDAAQVEEEAAAGRWNEVVARWTGDFLAGHDELGGESYREWLDGERARLVRISERAFGAVIEDAERRGALNDAVALARRWHDAFPDDERAAAALTRVLNAVEAAQPAAHHRVTWATTDVSPRDEVTTSSQTRSATTDRRRWLAYAGGLIATLTIGVSAARQSFERTESTPVDATQTVIVSDFRAVGVDTVLAQVAAEALRINLRQSRTLAVYPPAAVHQALRTLGTSGAPWPDVETARLIAARGGAKAVIAGEIVGNAGEYLVSVRLVATASGAELAQYSAETDSQGGLLRAVDKLAAKLRRAAGESLQSVEAARPVERVTTMSLDAFSRYVRATRAMDLEAAPARGIALLEEAIALDSTFAMAYRRLAVELNDRGGNDERVRDLITRAYDLRERLVDPERYAVEAAYYSFGPAPNEDKAIVAYEAALENDPRFGVPLINLTVIALRRHQFARAESLSKRVVARVPGSVQGHANLAQAQVSLGKLDSAAATIAHFDSVSPGSPRVAIARARLLNARGAHDSAAVTLRRVIDGSTDVVLRQTAAGMLRDLALARGDLSDGRHWAQVWTDAALQRRSPAGALAGALDQAWITLWFDHDTTAAFREVAGALERHPLRAIPPLDRPYGKLIRFYAWAGRPARARVALAGYDSAIGPHPRLNARASGPRYRGEIALAERRYGDAVANFRAADSTSCVTCLLPLLAITYDRMGVPDSARALWRRYVETPEYDRFETDASFLQLALRGRTQRTGTTAELVAGRR